MRTRKFKVLTEAGSFACHAGEHSSSLLVNGHWLRPLHGVAREYPDDRLRVAAQAILRLLAAFAEREKRKPHQDAKDAAAENQRARGIRRQSAVMLVKEENRTLEGGVKRI